MAVLCHIALNKLLICYSLKEVWLPRILLWHVLVLVTCLVLVVAVVVAIVVRVDVEIVAPKVVHATVKIVTEW